MVFGVWFRYDEGRWPVFTHLEENDPFCGHTDVTSRFIVSAHVPPAIEVLSFLIDEDVSAASPGELGPYEGEPPSDVSVSTAPGSRFQPPFTLPFIQARLCRASVRWMHAIASGKRKHRSASSLRVSYPLVKDSDAAAFSSHHAQRARDVV